MTYADPKKRKEYVKKWMREHPECRENWRRLHLEYFKPKLAEWSAKDRGLDFIALNKPFKNSAAHHIDEYFVIYVPKELHDSIRHSIKTGKNMKKINAKVFRWLASVE